MGGLRPALGRYGVTLTLQETSEYLGNVSGGTRRGGAYQGLTQLGVSVDTGTALGVPGGTFNVSGLQIHGTSLTQRNLQTLQAASGIEADASTRLWELWYQQRFAGGRADVKIGQQSIDQEFMLSTTATPFLNGTFGWAVLPSSDLPGGGPAYPLAAPGVRLRLTPSPAWTVLAGVFNGNPQQLDPHGTNFDLRSGALLIGEIQYALNPVNSDATPGASASPGAHAGLPGTYKLGLWYQTQDANDTGVDANGISLASAASTGTPARHRGNVSVYAVADQMLWRAASDSPRSLNAFARVMGAPGDRNLVSFAFQGGVTLKAPFAGRDNDVAGLAVGYTRIGSHARALDGAIAATTPGYPVRSTETVIEATYQYQVTPWWQMQADLQHVFRPAGGIPNPSDTGARIGDETIVGVRATLTF